MSSNNLQLLSQKTLLCISIAIAMCASVSHARTGAPATTVTTSGGSGGGVQGGGTVDDDAPEWMKRLAIDPASPRAKKYAEQAKSRKAVERELRKLRTKHFGRLKHIPTRQEGLALLRTYSDPALYPLLIEIFKDEDRDVLDTLMDEFMLARNPEADTALAWLAVQHTNPEIRTAATERLFSRVHKDKEGVEQIRLVIFEGLRSRNAPAMVSAAQLASGLNLIDVMPWLINAQVQGVPTTQGVQAGANGSRQGALAWIMVGEQTAFVSDLTPVVGNNAVAFDPELSVINTGVLLRVLDAAVVTYQIDLHNVLLDWSTREYGEDTKDLGWDVHKWRQWYKDDFLPRLAQREREAAEKLAQSQPQSQTTQGAQPNMKVPTATPATPSTVLPVQSPNTPGADPATQTPAKSPG